MLRRPLAMLALAAPGLLAGCGGAASDDGGVATAASHPVANEPYLTAGELERDLAGGVRAALYRVAVMGQKADDAADLGQGLPTGTVEDTACAPVGERPSGDAPWRWRCTVRWQSVSRSAHRTSYDVRLRHGRCFSAGAAPARPQRYDSTIRALAEDPLNVIVSARRGC